ncbi:hypothetical protein JCM3766R1_005648 [Sporobolomyces carnicolor]
MLDSGLVQTGLLLVAPFLVPSALKHVQAFLNPSPRGATKTKTSVARANVKRERAKDGRQLATFRLFVLTFGVSIALFTALLPPHNLFLSLSKPHSWASRWFPILRYPLDIRLATETIHRAWVHQLSRPLTESEASLVQRLQTLDARLSYIAYGATPLLHCSWCKPFATSQGRGGGGGDYLVSILPGVAIAWLSILTGIGFLLTGNGRERWRIWAAVAALAGCANELWKRLVWEGLRGGGGWTQGQTVSMLHSTLHVQRSIFAALCFIVAYLAPAALVSDDPSRGYERSSTSAIVAPSIRGLVKQSEQLLETLRTLSLERMAILHDDDYRSQVNHFWSTASQESHLARADPTVQALLDQSRDSEASLEFDAFVDRSFGPGRTARVVTGEEQGADSSRSDEVNNSGDEGHCES